MSYIWIIGAKSDIARALARVYAQNGYNLYLAGRNIDSITDLSKDIQTRNHVDVQLKEFDIAEFASHESFYAQLNPKPLGVIVVAGYMEDQKQCETDWETALNTIQVNYTGVVRILNIVANAMEKDKRGFIVGVSSVAGDRGRKANYIYGSSKSGLSAYLSGLRNRLFASNVHVLTVKPGFVNTKMTRHLDLPARLTADPEDVAQAIFHAQQKGRSILYTPFIWSWIMAVIKHIPECIFKRMSL